MATATNPTSTDRPLSIFRRDLMVLLLAVAGGSLDAVVILGFGVLTAAQTGNTILLAVSLAKGHVAAGLHSAISVVGYVSGAAVGELLIVERGETTGTASPVRRTLAAESVLLVLLLAIWHAVGMEPGFGPVAAMVVLAAAAMGIQSAAVLRLHVGPSTTYVTGTLTKFMTEAMRWLHIVRTAPPTAPVRQEIASADPLSGKAPWIYGVSWVVYGVGALFGALLFRSVHEIAVVLPIAAITVVLLVGVRGVAREPNTKA